jgi:hypothetical protein
VKSHPGVLFTDGRYAELANREVLDLEKSIYQADFAAKLAAGCHSLGGSPSGGRGACCEPQAPFRTLRCREAVDLVPSTNEVENG